MMFLTLHFSNLIFIFLALWPLESVMAQVMIPGVVTPQVFYEGQPFVEIGPQSSTQLKGFAELTVGFIHRSDIRWYGAWASLNQKSVYEEYKLCPGQALKNNPTSFFCSGAFISPNQILTAAHCLEDVKCGDLNFVRNAQLAKVIKGVPRSDVFTCKLIHILSEDRDLAIIETKQAYSGPIASVRRTSSRSQQGFIFMLGYPLGMPLHMSKGIITQQRGSFAMADLSAFEGNSGSPIFSQADGHLLGVLIEGEEDLQERRDLRCRQIVRCKRGECEGEKISLVTPNDLSQD